MKKVSLTNTVLNKLENAGFKMQKTKKPIRGWAFFYMAGVPGFEPGNAEIKTRCLTAWRYPKKSFVTNDE